MLNKNTPPKHPLVGKRLAINIEKCTRYQTFGFYVDVRNYVAIVPDRADFDGIERAIRDGKLLDVSDSVKGVKAPGSSSITGIREIAHKGNEWEKTVYCIFSEDDNGALERILAVPRDEAEARSWKFIVENRGRIVVRNFHPKQEGA